MENLPLFAPIIASGLLLVGLTAMTFPKWAAGMFGVKASTEGLPYVMAAGVRDVFIGLALLLIWQTGDHRLLAKAMVATAIVSLMDTYLVFKYGMRRQMALHILGTVAVVVYGFVLYSYSS